MICNSFYDIVGSFSLPRVPGLKLCEDRFKGVTQVFKEKAPNVKIIKVKVADDDIKGPVDWQAQIQAHPDALAFIGDCASTAPPILGKIKKETGAKWLVTGSELDPRTPALIKSGHIAGVTSASFWVQGYVAGRVLYEQIVNGKYTDYKGWIDSGTQVVTKSNVDAVIKALKSQDNLAAYSASRARGHLQGPQVASGAVQVETLVEQRAVAGSASRGGAGHYASFRRHDPR